MATQVNFDTFQASREVAEGVVKRAMTPLRKIIDEYKEEPDGSLSVTLTLHDVRSVDADLGIIGSILATQFGKEVKFQETLKEFAEENVRLHAGVDVLAHHLSEAHDDISSLSNRLGNAERVNAKLKEITRVPVLVEETKPSFKVPDLV